MVRIQIKLQAVKQFDLDPESFDPADRTPERMLAIMLEQCDDQPDLIMDAPMIWTLSGMVIDPPREPE